MSKLSARRNFLKWFKTSGISQITRKLFKKYRKPGTGAFHFPQRGKEIPN